MLFCLEKRTWAHLFRATIQPTTALKEIHSWQSVTKIIMGKLLTEVYTCQVEGQILDTGGTLVPRCENVGVQEQTVKKEFLRRLWCKEAVTREPDPWAGRVALGS